MKTVNGLKIFQPAGCHLFLPISEERGFLNGTTCDGFVSPATQMALQNLTEQDYIPSPAPKKDYSWLKQMRAERDRGPEWDDWEL